MAAARRSSSPESGPARTCAPAALLSLALVLPVVLAIACDGLFFPPTGFPEDGPGTRSTPDGAIYQLFRAYEEQRIDLFTELLPKNGTYRFFISPDYSDAYAASHSTDAIIARIEEGEYAYVAPGTYYYWGHESELAKHRRLFRMAGAIWFTEYPAIVDEDYRVSDNGDTTHVEVKTIGGEFCIDARDTLYYVPERGKMQQIFLLEREADRRTGDRLWVIKEWFDLNQI